MQFRPQLAFEVAPAALFPPSMMPLMRAARADVVALGFPGASGGQLTRSLRAAVKLRGVCRRFSGVLTSPFASRPGAARTGSTIVLHSGFGKRRQGTPGAAEAVFENWGPAARLACRLELFRHARRAGHGGPAHCARADTRSLHGPGCRGILPRFSQRTSHVALNRLPAIESRSHIRPDREDTTASCRSR